MHNGATKRPRSGQTWVRLDTPQHTSTRASIPGIQNSWQRTECEQHGGCVPDAVATERSVKQRRNQRNKPMRPSEVEGVDDGPVESKDGQSCCREGRSSL